MSGKNILGITDPEFYDLDSKAFLRSIEDAVRQVDGYHIGTCHHSSGRAIIIALQMILNKCDAQEREIAKLKQRIKELEQPEGTDEAMNGRR